MRIDMHGHLVPSAWLEAFRTSRRAEDPHVQPDAEGRLWVHTPGGASWQAIPALHDVTMRAGALAASGFDHQLVLPPTGVVDYTLEPSAAQRSARVFNESISDVAVESGLRLVPSCTVPVQDVKLAEVELNHAVIRLGARAVLLGTNPNGVPFDDESLFPLFRRVSELGIPVVLHPDKRLMSPRLAKHGLANLVGNPLDTTVAASQFLVGGVLERLPDLRLVLVHGGGALPLLLGRWRHGVAIAGGSQDRIDRVLSQVIVDSLVHDDLALGYVLGVMGRSNVVVGTDDPYPMGEAEPFARIARLDIHGLEEAMAETAQRLLGLDDD